MCLETSTGIEEKLERLGAEYERQTEFHSFRHMMIEAPAYKELITMGLSIVPFILQGFGDGRIGGVNWFIVLEEIIGEKPLKPEFLSGTAFIDVQRTREAWIQWGKKHGHIA